MKLICLNKDCAFQKYNHCFCSKEVMINEKGMCLSCELKDLIDLKIQEVYEGIPEKMGLHNSMKKST